jgi:hypothetical protein
MAISASQIVQVLPRILTGTGTDLVFNGMVLDDNVLLPAATPLSFSSADAVGEYFGLTSDEYNFAVVYFGGYNNSQIKPSLLYFYRLTPSGAAPFVRGETLAPATALAAIKAVSAGDIKISLSGTEYTATGIDFSAVTSLSDAASVLQTALTTQGAGVTVAYNSVNNAFTITSTAVGEQESITVPTGTAAVALGFNAETATVSAGENATDVVGSMTALTHQFQNFVTFTTLAEPEDADALALANWVSAQANAGTMYLYICWDSSKANLDTTNTTVIAEKIKALNATGTTVVYPSYNIAAFVMGTAASIAWDQTNGTITFAFKAQSGLAADVTDTQHSVALLEHGVNFIGNYATRNDNFVFFYNGQMFGEWLWIDTYLNACYLCNKLQVQLMAMFTSNRRIPYTSAGYAIIRANCRDVIEAAINNGVIDIGVSLSNAQKSQLTSELGGDFSDEIYNNGYYLQVLDATAQARQQRVSPPCNLVYTYGGAVQRLTVPAIAVV